MDFPIEGTLDLRTFIPEDVNDLVPDYLDECRRRGILKVRIVHGKGTGVLQRIVHSILDKLPEVVDYSCGGNT
jgi:dsDNA-specific endonuclease/ATPase MutS2